jgi:S1-C subfamily serine protease
MGALPAMRIAACLLLILLAEEVPLLDSKDFPRETQEGLIWATVRVVNKDQRQDGSGVIVRQQGPFVYILTAHHIADKADSVVITTFSPKSYPKPEKVYSAATVLARAKEPDLALIRLVTRDMVPSTLRICPADMLPPEKDFAVLNAGCAPDKPPTCEAAKVTGKKLIRRPDGETAHVWELNRGSSPGRSGGPLIDKRGFVIGVASGQGDGKGYYIHLDELHRFLKQINQQRLLEAPKQ